MVNLSEWYGQTRADLRFHFLGFPVRVHPLFWLAALILGGGGDPGGVMIWVVVCFVSLLLHEIGHALMMRASGDRPEVVLYVLGGLTLPRGRQPNLQSQILISFAGPFVGFCLAGLTIVLVRLAGGHTSFAFAGIGPPLFLASLWKQPPAQLSGAWYADVLVNHILYVNLYWGFLNLLPIYPLDGGRISRAMFLMADSGHGVRKSLRLSVAVAVIFALLSLLAQSVYAVVLFGVLAAISMQTLETIGPAFRPSTSWRR